MEETENEQWSPRKSSLLAQIRESEFQSELKAIVMDIGKAFEKTALEISKDREHVPHGELDASE